MKLEEADTDQKQIVIVEFPASAAFDRWWNSPESSRYSRRS